MSEEMAPSNQELAAQKLNELKGYLTDARDVHGRAALLPKDHPRHHPDNIDAYHAWNHTLDTLDDYVKGGGFDEDWEKFDNAFKKQKSHIVSSDIVEYVQILQYTNINCTCK